MTIIRIPVIIVKPVCGSLLVKDQYSPMKMATKVAATPKVNRRKQGHSFRCVLTQNSKLLTSVLFIDCSSNAGGPNGVPVPSGCIWSAGSYAILYNIVWGLFLEICSEVLSCSSLFEVASTSVLDRTCDCPSAAWSLESPGSTSVPLENCDTVLMYPWRRPITGGEEVMFASTSALSAAESLSCPHEEHLWCISEL